MKHQFIPRAMASLILTGVIAGCGGGGSGGAQTANLNGRVIDGYIEGATVCLDLNVNQVCDPGEPSAGSNADGSYSLDITGLTAAQISAAHLYTTVPDTARDKDDGGKTLAQAGKAPFNLMAPSSFPVISPLTTLVSHDMISGNGKSLDDAEKSVRVRTGLAAGADLKQDFVSKPDANLIQLAQVLAVAIGEVKKAARKSGSTDDRENLFAALSYLQQNVVALQDAASNPSGGTVLAQVIAALARVELKPDVTALIDDARKVTASSAVDIAAILGEGFYDGECLLGACSARYFKTSGANGTWQGADYTLSGGSWIKDGPSSSSGSYMLTANGWVARVEGDSGTYASDGQGGGTATETGSGKRFRFSARMVDVSGKTAGSIAGLSLPADATDFSFAPGSKLYWMQTTSLDDEYRLDTAKAVHVMEECTTTNPDCIQRNLTSIADIIQTYSTGNASTYNRYFGTFGAFYTFDGNSTSTGGTVSLWTNGSNTCSVNTLCRTKTGSAPYEIKTVSGQQVLIIKAQAYDNRHGEYVMFAAKGGLLYVGTHEPAGADQSIDASFNKAGMNSIMTAGSKPQVLN